MNAELYIKPPTCKNSSDGTISIKRILLNNQEKKQYGNYYIEWSENIQRDQIKKNQVINLTEGVYSYRLYGPHHNSEWFEVKVEAPTAIEILDITTGHDCDNHTSYIDVYVTGGKPPYIGLYDTKIATSKEDKITFKNLSYHTAQKIKITDSNNCSIESKEIISTDHSFYSVEVSAIRPPIIYDDHPDQFDISIYGTSGPYHLKIQADDQNEFVNISTEYCSITENIHTYNLSSIVYPGPYTLEITDRYGCVKLVNIYVPNKHTFSAQVRYTNNQILAQTIISTTEKIINTILIPYNLLINNLTLIEWLQNNDNNQELDIIVGKKTYKQKIKHNYLDSLLVLGQSSNDWYYPIIIRRGFDLKKDLDVFVDQIKITIGENEYKCIPEFDSCIDCFQLIRSNILTTTTNTNDFTQQNILQLHEKNNNEYSYLTKIYYTFTEYFSNSYITGNLFGINIIDNNTYKYKLNIYDPMLPVLSETDVADMQNTKNALKILNDWNKDICISPYISFKDNASISIWTNTKANIRYYKYDTTTQKISDVYLNNEIAQAPLLLNLNGGLYIVKISDGHNDKLKLLNNQPYDDHYISAKLFIKDKLGTTTNSLNFQYGDILINILDCIGKNETQPLFGLELLIENRNTNKLATILSKSLNEIYVTTNNSYNNSLNITLPYNVEHTISGPDNISYSFTENIKLINLPIGVYTIIGNQDMLKEKFYTGQNYEIFVDKNQHLFIDLKISSYYNKPIIK